MDWPRIYDRFSFLCGFNSCYELYLVGLYQFLQVMVTSVSGIGTYWIIRTYLNGFGSYLRPDGANSYVVLQTSMFNVRMRKVDVSLTSLGSWGSGGVTCQLSVHSSHLKCNFLGMLRQLGYWADEIAVWQVDAIKLTVTSSFSLPAIIFLRPDNLTGALILVWWGVLWKAVRHREIEILGTMKQRRWIDFVFCN